MLLTKFFPIFLICLLVNCGNSISQSENTNQTQQIKNADLFLRMEKSECSLGTCPAYISTIQNDGKVEFEGLKFTKIKGKIESSLSKEKMERLTSEINKIDFFALEDSYINCSNRLSDGITVNLTVKLKEREKKVSHYWGCYEDNTFKKVTMPQLYNLENKIDEIAETKRWIGEPK